jgi:competence protein ComEC
VATSAHEAIAAARARQVPIVGLHAGMRFTLGAATVEVLAPSVALPAGGDANATSIVVRVTGDHGRMLLTGDSEAQAQEQMLARPDLLRADVLKVPHHGGATNTPGFLDAVQAKVAVMSVGADNRYGHPNRDTLVDLAPVPVWRTDRHGSVAVTLTPAGPVVDNDV